MQASMWLKSRVGTDTVSAGKTWVTLAEQRLVRVVEWIVDKLRRRASIPNSMVCAVGDILYSYGDTLQKITVP
jgi:hypothetical protein